MSQPLLFDFSRSEVIYPRKREEYPRSEVIYPRNNEKPEQHRSFFPYIYVVIKKIAYGRITMSTCYSNGLCLDFD